MSTVVAKPASKQTRLAASASQPTPQSNIIQHVPTRARSIEQILEFAKKSGIANEMLIKVGLRMNGNLLFGSNQRCVAMLIVFKSIMDDVSNSLSSSPMKDLQLALKQAMDFLDISRPLSISMTNAYKLVNEEILKLSQASANEVLAQLMSSGQVTNPTVHDEQTKYEEQKKQLKDFIDRFIDEEIWSAQRGICENIVSNITTNDVILVYGCSTIVQHVLLHAKCRGKTSKVIVVDSPPHFNGRRMSSFLNENSIDFSYTLINSLSFFMRQATKVLLGANSLLANGYVMSHIGTSQVALMANAFNVPTLVCCETYKLNDRVYVDSFGCNEVDSGHELGSVLNLRYDLTPPEFISMVINEKSTVPANSVAALLRFRAEKTNTSQRLT